MSRAVPPILAAAAGLALLAGAQAAQALRNYAQSL